MEDPAFERALSQEILASEQMRARVLAATLTVVLTLASALFRPAAESFAVRPPPVWVPLAVIGPFLAYEILIILVLRVRIRRKAPLPLAARLANATIETSLPTVILWAMTRYLGPEIAFGSWAEMLYLVFIIASTLRLDFLLPAFTGAVGATGYLTVAILTIRWDAGGAVASPIYHLAKVAVILGSGIVAGLVASRLRSKFRAAYEDARARERVTSVFGQHVSPAVVDKLLTAPDTESAGELREICVVFLDIRNFTAAARQRPAAEVVEFLNQQFAYMIDAIDRHGGFINKFLGDGFLAVFGAPLADPNAVQNAVAACRDILAEIDRRAAGRPAWPFKVGIGIHAGTAVVGNVGSPRRKEFTVIGDTVNLAARLEQLTKEYGAQLIVSEAVMRRLGGTTTSATPLAELQVKGYDTPIKAWRLA